MQALYRVCGQAVPVLAAIGVPLICFDVGLSIAGVLGGLFVGIGLAGMIVLLQERSGRKPQ